MRLETSPAQWNKIQGIIENISRETSQDLKRKKSTVRLDQGKPTPQKRDKTPEKVQEDHHPYYQPQQIQTNTRRSITIIKGLNFIPTPKKEHPAKLLQGILLFDRRLRLKYFSTKIQPTHNQLNRITQHYTQVLDGHHLQDRTHF